MARRDRGLCRPAARDPGSSHAEESNPNNYNCLGNIDAGQPEAGSEEQQVNYTFYCDGPITGYQLQTQVPLTGDRRARRWSYSIADQEPAERHVLLLGRSARLRGQLRRRGQGRLRVDHRAVRDRHEALRRAARRPAADGHLRVPGKRRRHAGDLRSVRPRAARKAARRTPSRAARGWNRSRRSSPTRSKHKKPTRAKKADATEEVVRLASPSGVGSARDGRRAAASPASRRRPARERCARLYASGVRRSRAPPERAGAAPGAPPGRSRARGRLAGSLACVVALLLAACGSATATTRPTPPAPRATVVASDARPRDSPPRRARARPPWRATLGAGRRADLPRGRHRRRRRRGGASRARARPRFERDRSRQRRPRHARRCSSLLLNQIVRIEVLRGGHVFATAGAGRRSRPCAARSRARARASCSRCRRTAAYLQVARQITGAQIAAARRRLGGWAGTITGPAPVEVPASGPLSVGGQSYQVFSLAGAPTRPAPCGSRCSCPPRASPAPASPRRRAWKRSGASANGSTSEELHSR